MYSSGVQGVQPTYALFMNIITEQLLRKTALQCQTRLAQKLRCYDAHKRVMITIGKAIHNQIIIKANKYYKSKKFAFTA